MTNWSEAGKKAWRTRRRREAARKAWVTRRRNGKATGLAARHASGKVLALKPGMKLGAWTVVEVS